MAVFDGLLLHAAAARAHRRQSFLVKRTQFGNLKLREGGGWRKEKQKMCWPLVTDGEVEMCVYNSRPGGQGKCGQHVNGKSVVSGVDECYRFKHAAVLPAWPHAPARRTPGDRPRATARPQLGQRGKKLRARRRRKEMDHIVD